MQKLEAVRDRARGSGNWLRLGVVFTTSVAPIIARWNDLRMTKRDLRQREETEARLASPRAVAQARLTGLRARVSGRGAISNHNHHDQHDHVLVSLPLTDASQPAKTRMRSDSVRVGLWVAGVVIGLVAAGAGAYFLARRRMKSSAEEPLLELPANGPRGDGSRSAASARGERARDTTSPASRSGAPITTDHSAAPTIPDAADEFGPDDIVEPGMPGPAGRRGRSTMPPEGAAFVGNIHTMIYHDATDLAHLPAEENRVYFASEDEAREANFRRDRREAPPTPEAGIITEGPTA